MLGSSVIFVRRKPDRSGPSRVSVTERGVPEQAAEEMRPERVGVARERPVPFGRNARRDDERSGSGGPYAAPPAAAAAAAPREAPGSEGEARAFKGGDKAADSLGEAPSPARSRGVASTDDMGDGVGALAQRAAESKKKEEPTAGGAQGEYAGAPKDAYGSAMDLYGAGRYAEADKAFTDVAASGVKNAAMAALYSAKSTEAAFGCGRAAAKYEGVAARYTGTSAAAEAQWGAANCYKISGNLERAHALYNGLRSVAGYRDRAEGELENLKILQQQVAAKATRAQPPAKPAAPQATGASKPANQQ